MSWNESLTCLSPITHQSHLSTCVPVLLPSIALLTTKVRKTRIPRTSIADGPNESRSVSDPRRMKRQNAEGKSTEECEGISFALPLPPRPLCIIPVKLHPRWGRTYGAWQMTGLRKTALFSNCMRSAAYLYETCSRSRDTCPAVYLESRCRSQ
jgi:hypothetical protein